MLWTIMVEGVSICSTQNYMVISRLFLDKNLFLYYSGFSVSKNEVETAALSTFVTVLILGTFLMGCCFYLYRRFHIFDLLLFHKMLLFSLYITYIGIIYIINNWKTNSGTVMRMSGGALTLLWNSVSVASHLYQWQSMCLLTTAPIFHFHLFKRLEGSQKSLVSPAILLKNII